MWKFVSRSFRESLERGLGFSRSTGNCQEPPRQQKCSKFTSFSRATSKARVCSTPHWPECQNRQQSQGSSHTPPPNEEETQQRNGTQFGQDSKECILGAFSCSSALVLGWVLTQPYYHWRKWWSKDRCHLRSHCPLSNAFFYRPREPIITCKFRFYDPLASLLRGLNLTKLLPVSLAAPNTSPVLLSSDHEESRQQEIEYGPLTAEQALDEAAEEIRLVHEQALNVSENRRGVEAASRHRHAKAVALFRSAAARSYAPAQYNLAQCYELGMGTKQDFSVAAEWYKKAAELGHAGAMYNLAVFYAHGWGGLEADPIRARQLLVMAAKKGQPDAMAALGYPGQASPTAVAPMIDKEDLWASNEPNEPSPEEPDSQLQFSNNPTALFNLARSFENSSPDNSDPYLIMDLYKFASDLGHAAAQARLQILKSYDAVGLLNEFLFLSNNKTGDLCDANFLLDQN